MKLSPAQSRVMTLMSQNRSARKNPLGCAVYIDDKRVCNIDTMWVLERLGLVHRNARCLLRATDAGLNWMPGND